ncbi:hydroxysqualene dehydroxylase HpnE [Streptomyces niveus]
MPASPPWPVSTAGCSTASNATPAPSCAAGSHCRDARRRTSPCAASPVSTPGTSPGRASGGARDTPAGHRHPRLPARGHRHHGRTDNPPGGGRVPDCDSPGGGRMTTTDSTGSRHAVVVGGGIAGVTAALQLADAGVRVTLVEGRPRLGGLAFSFTRGELTVDNGQHVYLRCCTAYRWLLDRIDGAALAPVQDRLDVPVLDVGRPDRPRVGRLRRDALPVPLHLAGGLATYPHLSLAEKAFVGRAALALKALDPADPALDGIDFATWLRRHGQSARAVEALWNLVCVATLNVRAEQASMGLAAMVFKTGLLSERGAADIGWARVPLGELHDTLSRKALDSAGVRTELRTRVTAVARTEDGRWSVDVPGERIEADTVILAVPQRETHALLPDGALDQPGRLLDIGTSPILNVHVVYDRQVLRRPFFAAIGTPVQWVFDRTDASGLKEGQYVALSQSAVADEIDLPVAELRERYLPELKRLLPAARSAEVRDFFVTRERTATFAPTPGVGRLRPAARTRAAGLFLAGAWTATGWPATMEGAVRSGFSAAGEALSELGRTHRHPLREAA